METQVIIIDDNQYMSKLISYALEDAGFDRHTHFSSVEAFRKAGYEPRPDCLIIDHSLPGLSGTEFTQMVRDGETILPCDITIILCIFDPDEDLVKNARDAGATELCAKPLSPLNLVKKLQMALERPRDFVDCVRYKGPDRRRKKRAQAVPDRRDKKRPMSQNDIDALLKETAD